MTKGEGLVALLYALKGIIEAGAVWVITSFGILSFFFLIVTYIGQKFGVSVPNWFGLGSEGGISGKVKPIDNKKIIGAIFLLFVLFSVYSLIALTASVFGVNSSPTGGLLVR
jgi:hypothetical protein